MQTSNQHEELKAMGYAPYEAAQLVGADPSSELDGIVSGGGNKRTSDDAGITLDDMLLQQQQQQQQQPKKMPPPNGKKTKGRVKIKMEFIDNKLRRYTTFSKRKTGIMKKVSVISPLAASSVTQSMTVRQCFRRLRRRSAR